MPFLMIVVLVVACSPLPWPEAPYGSGAAGAIAAGMMPVVVALLAAGSATIRVVRGLRRTDADRGEVIHKYVRARVRQPMLLLLTFASCLWCGWGYLIRTELARWPGFELVLISPFIVGQLISWLCCYSADRALFDSSRRLVQSEERFGGRFSYVLHQARQNLAMIGLPIVLLVVQQGIGRMLPESAGEIYEYVVLAGLLSMLWAMPWFLRLVLGLRPIPPGPLRQALEDTGRRLRLRYSALLVWPTRQTVVNAMIAGLVPWPRYILFTDRLLNDLSPEEVESVLGHEAGHVLHRHMPFYAAFLALSLGLLVGVGGRVEQMGWFDPIRPWIAGWEVIPGAVIMFGYVIFVFGLISRGCERQADLAGCRAVSCGRADCYGHDDVELPIVRSNLPICRTAVRTFVGALDKVADLNGQSRDRPGLFAAWQHGSIAQRVRFLLRTGIHPLRERRFQRRFLMFKAFLMAMLIAGNVANYALWPMDETPQTAFIPPASRCSSKAATPESPPRPS